MAFSLILLTKNRARAIYSDKLPERPKAMVVMRSTPPARARGAPPRRIAQRVDFISSMNTCICPERGQKVAARLGRAPR